MTCRYKLSDDDSVASELGGSEVVSSAIEVTVTVVNRPILHSFQGCCTKPTIMLVLQQKQ